MRKATKDALRLFIEKNYIEITNMPLEKARLAQGNLTCCVLRPFTLPENLRKAMTYEQYRDYFNIANVNSSIFSVNKARDEALKWIDEQ